MSERSRARAKRKPAAQSRAAAGTRSKARAQARPRTRAKPAAKPGAQIVSLLASASLFSALGKEELEALAEYAELASHRRGEVILRAGDPSDALYIVQQGEVVVSKEVAEGQSITLASFIAGDCFGELDFFSRTPRNATAVAEKDTVLLAFPGRTVSFDSLIATRPRVFAKVLHAFLATVAQRIRATNRLITENAPWVKELRRQLHTDAQTGLYTKAYLEGEASSFLADPTALIMLKPDNFKQLNDSHGHKAGDGAMTLLAAMLQPLLGARGFGVRYRGNEVALVLPGAGEQAARETADALRRSVKALDLAPITGGTGFRFTASLGVVVHRGEISGWQASIGAAYELLYRARNDGGDRVYGA
jgi:diguanylate cyclase (GGDEF)-like protein